MNSQTITVAGIEVAVEVRRDGKVIPVAQWPITLAEIAQQAQAVFTASGCRADRADLAWAVHKAGLGMADERYMYRVVPTASEDWEIRQAARDEAQDGLV